MYEMQLSTHHAEMFAPEGDFVFKKESGLKISAVPLSAQENSSAKPRIPEEVQSIMIEVSSRYDEVQTLVDEGGGYLDEQLDKYMGREGGLSPDAKLNEVLDYTYSFLVAGTGSRNVEPNAVSVKQIFDIDEPKKTNCSYFNGLYKAAFEAVVRKFCPSMEGKYSMLTTKSKYATDLGTGKMVTPESDMVFRRTKYVDHRFLTLVSVGEVDSLIYTPLDPYHISDEGRPSESLDFNGRVPDSLRTVVKALTEPFYNSARSDYLRTVFFTDSVENLKSPTERLGLGLIVTNELWPVLKNRIKQSEDGSNHKSVREAVTLISLREKLTKTITSVADFAMDEMDKNLEKLDFELLTGFMEMVDNCGRLEVPISLGDWQKINQFLDRLELRKDVLEAASKELSQYLSTDLSKIRFNKKPGVAIFRSHFIHTGRTPTTTLITEEDKISVATTTDMAYQEFRVKMLKIALTVGVKKSQIDLPEGEYLDGTRAKYFADLCRGLIKVE